MPVADSEQSGGSTADETDSSALEPGEDASREPVQQGSDDGVIDWLAVATRSPDSLLKVNVFWPPLLLSQFSAFLSSFSLMFSAPPAVILAVASEATAGFQCCMSVAQFDAIEVRATPDFG